MAKSVTKTDESNLPTYNVGPLSDRPETAIVNSLYQSIDGNQLLYRYLNDKWQVDTSNQ